MNNYFKLFACCITVVGAERSIICDIQRGSFEFIPNDFLEILISYKNDNFEGIIKIYGEDNRDTIKEYFDFLIQKEYGFWCEKQELALFPELNLEWDSPFQITNVIFDENSNTNIENIIIELEKLGNTDIQMRFFSEIPLQKLECILQLFGNKRVKSLQLFLKYSDAISEEMYQNLCLRFLRIFTIIIHSANEEKEVLIALNNVSKIYYTKEKITDASHCGIISPSFFVANISTFTESQTHNTCLNRKISIDVNGEIKNCPSMLKSYGNIKDTTLSETLDKQGFKDLWYVHKDQIKVCKDCEFRHICTDCRAYIQDPKDIFSKPAKCGYDPYTATWGEEILQIIRYINNKCLNSLFTHSQTRWRYLHTSKLTRNSIF